MEEKLNAEVIAFPQKKKEDPRPLSEEVDIHLCPECGTNFFLLVMDGRVACGTCDFILNHTRWGHSREKGPTKKEK